MTDEERNEILSAVVHVEQIKPAVKVGSDMANQQTQVLRAIMRGGAGSWPQHPEVMWTVGKLMCELITKDPNLAPRFQIRTKKGNPTVHVGLLKKIVVTEALGAAVIETRPEHLYPELNDRTTAGLMLALLDLDPNLRIEVQHRYDPNFVEPNDGRAPVLTGCVLAGITTVVDVPTAGVMAIPCLQILIEEGE